MRSTSLPGTANRIEVERFMERGGKLAVSALLLDYDGTLAPFCLNRQQAVPYPGVAALLQEIIDDGRTRVVIITGRNAHEVIPLLAVHPSPEIWGMPWVGAIETGRDLRNTAGGQSRYVQPALADADRWLKSQGLHNRAEFKTGAIAIHWRGLNKAMVAETRSQVLLGWRPIAQNTPLELLEFDGGIEMRKTGCDKGDAVRTDPG